MSELRGFMNQVDDGVQIISFDGSVEVLGEGVVLTLPHGLEGPRVKSRKARETTPFWANDWRRKPC